MAAKKPAEQQYKTFGELANDIAGAEFRYGNDGQLNVSTPKREGETNREHEARSKEFVETLATIGGVDKQDVRASGTRGVIMNPGENIRKIMDGLAMPRTDVVQDKVKGDDGEMLHMGTRSMVEKATAKLALALEEVTGLPNENIPGKFTRNEIKKGVDPKPGTHGHSRGL